VPTGTLGGQVVGLKFAHAAPVACSQPEYRTNLLPVCPICSTAERVTHAKPRPPWPNAEFFQCGHCRAEWGMAPALPVTERRRSPRQPMKADV
jgi:hypothetical protein